MTSKSRVAPYGSWESPITSEMLASSALRLSQIFLDGKTVNWIEQRPDEGGRRVVVRYDPESGMRDLTPAPFNARTLVHEYGGGDYFSNAGAIYFSNYADQRIYRQAEGETTRAVTEENGFRYADGIFDRDRQRIICVREDHREPASEAVNTIVAVRLDSATEVLTSGRDFYASPRLSPGGESLAWLAWGHPNMPWDGCELWAAAFDANGALLASQQVAGGPSESIFQPEWSPDGRLYFVSDRSGWWNLYRWDGEQVEPVLEMEAEFGLPHWVFGRTTYAFASADWIICGFALNGEWKLGLLNPEAGDLEQLDTSYTAFEYLRADEDAAYFVGGSPTEPDSIVKMDLRTKTFTVLRRSTPVSIDAGSISSPETVQFPTAEGKLAYAYFYPPRNADYEAPEHERPPLIVSSHGGPTSATDTTLDLAIQHWTSRGIAVLDVNYGGSTGYGREYRTRLEGQWGIVDVDDCTHAAKYLVEQGRVDPDRIAIRGGSAGGYTTLSALTFRQFFSAGASYFGVSDLAALAEETHKFESRYLDRLVGPYPERADLYVARSPIHHLERLSVPMIFFQGLEDAVVPPSQSERMFDALRKKGVPVAYLAFEGEQHGFRKAENIIRAREAELYFYSRLFQFEPADHLDPVPIENLGRTR